MPKFKAYRDLDYVQGHLRYGHQEGVIEADSKEEALEMLEDDPYAFCKVVVDDYEIDDWDAGNNKFQLEEITEE